MPIEPDGTTLTTTYPVAGTDDPMSMREAGAFYHSEAWLALLGRLYGYDVMTLLAHDTDGHTTGRLPVSLMRSRFTGRRLVSLPFSDYCPLVSADVASANDLVDQAIELAQQHRVRYLELRSGSSDALKNRSDLLESSRFVRWYVPLGTDSDAVWSALRKPVKRQVRKARKLGVEIYHARRVDEVDHYYQLHLRTRCRKHGMPAQPRRFFSSLWDEFASWGTMHVLLAQYDGKPIAGMVLIASGMTLRYAYGASDEQFLYLAPNNLLMWEAIAWGCSQGYQVLDLGRTARENHGLMEFKRGWGATQEPLPYYYYPKVTGLATTSEQSRKFHILTSCWRHLPLPVAEVLGAKVYRHLG